MSPGYLPAGTTVWPLSDMTSHCTDYRLGSGPEGRQSYSMYDASSSSSIRHPRRLGLALS